MQQPQCQGHAINDPRAIILQITGKLQLGIEGDRMPLAIKHGDDSQRAPV